MNKKRIFWLGMHKVLVRTELPALREMGYEVFNPPYLSNVQDQSAELNWTQSESSLPEDIYEKLSKYNFFYNSISNEVAEILNEYFDAIIVTINPDWLVSILEVFKKTIIYRTYGQIGILSESLLHNGGYKLIQERENFWFVPHCEETASDEQHWLKNKLKVCPYWLTDDVFALQGKWEHRKPKKPHIGLTCPNITNPYYQGHFNYLKAYFEQRCFRYFGAQLEENADPNVVGTLPRERYLEEFLFLSGYLYTYRERNVCFLPPIEMMVFGGPVLYFSGSLLHRYFNAKTPGLVWNEDEALRKAKLLIKGDSQFVTEIIASQPPIVERYSKSFGLPVFRRVISEILDGTGPPKSASAAINKKSSERFAPSPVLLFAHFRGAYVFSNGEYSTMHGIPRVMRQFVRALTSVNVPVVVTAWSDDLINTHGFYSSQCDNPDLVSVVSVDDLGIGVTKAQEVAIKKNEGIISKVLKFFVGRSSFFRSIRDRHIHNPSTLNLIELILVGLYRVLLRIQNKAVYSAACLRAKVIKLTNKVLAIKNSVLRKKIREQPQNHVRVCGTRSAPWRYVIIPHYYLFPEVLTAGFDRVLSYIPDYMPYLFKGRNYFPEDGSHLEVGRKVVGLSTRVLTNSAFTTEYLPNCPLRVPKEKIVAFPMPFLSIRKDVGEEKSDHKVISKLSEKKFIFYPTQPHPNKRLDLLIRSWILINKLRPDLLLELTFTCGDIPPPLWDLIRKERLEPSIHLFPGISDSTLSWLYKNAVCLAFTSEFEGNFPTQVLEALEYRCPIVAMENPLITNELGEISRHLLIAPFADIDSFSNYVIYTAENRNEVLKHQENVLDFVRGLHSFEGFTKNVIELDRLMQG
ncbi:glycosyltransferase [Candidatus Manganitrophus noduliformans]|nr:glycosyltransferase [Candidatus Manganitrophus noduliformans]